MGFNQTEIAIIKTLSYADVFDASMDIDELYCFLISSKKISSQEIFNNLEKLKEKKVIRINKGLAKVGEERSSYQLRSATDNMSYNKIKTYNSTNKLYQTVTVSNYIKLFSSVEAVLVTGSVSRMNGTLQDDVDLLVITKPGTLWKTRLGLTLLFEYLSKRRQPKEDVEKTRNNERYCFNMYLDSDHLKVPDPYQNIYTAHEVVQARPLFSRNQTYQKFLAENNWVTNFLAHSPRIKMSKPTSLPTDLKSETTSLLMQKIETMSYNVQKLYMRGKITNETVEPGKALFHPRKTGVWVINEYKKRLSQFGIDV